MNPEAHVMQAREKCNATPSTLQKVCVGCALDAVQAALKEDRLKVVAMVRRYMGHRRDDPEPDATLEYVIREIEEETYANGPEGADRAPDPERPSHGDHNGCGI
jgi:hypothetical protein